MPKFIIKHGCCYIPPVENNSSTTCQVFSNPDFDSSPSHDLCGMGKSSPEFANHPKQISWGYLDHDSIVKTNFSKSTEPTSEEVQKSTTTAPYHTKKFHENENLSLFTIYGNKTRTQVYDSDKYLQNRPLSEGSIYRPTTANKIPEPSISSSEKFLDCISTCLWKCSAWCQKID